MMNSGSFPRRHSPLTLRGIVLGFAGTLLVSGLELGCFPDIGVLTPTPTLTQTPEPSFTPTATPSGSPLVTPSPTPIGTPSLTPHDTSSPAVSPTPTEPPDPTASPTPGPTSTPPNELDLDGDGFHPPIDCDDQDPEIYPGAVELPANLTDDDCDGLELCYQDLDGDKYIPDASATLESDDLDCNDSGESKNQTLTGDCNDGRADVYPDADELCDGIDNDCDGTADEALNRVAVAGQFCVPASSFVRGSDPTDTNARTDEQPETKVFVDAFLMDGTEVTNRDYATFLNQHPGNLSPEGVAWIDLANSHIHPKTTQYEVDVGYELHPVMAVTWYGARDYCAAMSKALPTEAEWEKAARSGCEQSGSPECEDPVDERTYPWGEDLNCNLANFSGCIEDTVPVMSYPGGRSVYGLYDLAGNVAEWVADWYASTAYQPGQTTNPTGPATGTNKVRRGGGYDQLSSWLRVARRDSLAPTLAYQDVGFRCVLRSGVSPVSR